MRPAVGKQQDSGQNSTMFRAEDDEDYANNLKFLGGNFAGHQNSRDAPGYNVNPFRLNGVAAKSWNG